MLLTELLFQRVRGLSAQDSVALKPGYVAIVSRAIALRSLLVASLFPDPEDQKKLVEPPTQGGKPPGPTRVGVGLLGRDGTPYRLLREIGAQRQLHKFDPSLKRFASLTQDDQQIASFLRSETELPSPESYPRFFILGPGELPSTVIAARTPSANLALADLGKAAALKSELEQTRQFEEAQDKLFRVQQKLHEMSAHSAKLEAAETDFNELEQQLSRSLFTPGQIRELTARAGRVAGEERKHKEQISDLQAAQRTLENEVPPEPEPLHRDPLLWGGAAGGIALDALSFLVGRPWVALLGLIPFGAALIAVLRWIDAREQFAGMKAQQRRLAEREAGVRKAFNDEQAPLRAALQAAGAESPEELVDLFKHRDEVAKLRDDARGRLDAVRALPEIAEVEHEKPRLLEEKAQLEMAVSAQGFARPLAEIERDLRRAMGIVTDPSFGPVRSTITLDPVQAPRLLIEQAAAVLALSPGELWQQLGGRLASYLAALTDKRVVAARLDSSGQLSCFAPDGRGGPYPSLPQPLRDLVYTALRLCLLERVAKQRKLPLFIDDTFGSLEPIKRGLVHKMLKGIAADTQVVHRMVEPPPPNLADHTVQVA